MKTAKLAVDFPPKCYLFCECNSDRIGQNIQNEVMFINLYPVSRGPLIFLDKSGSLKEHCTTRRKPEQYSSLEQIEFRETSIFYTHYLKGFREMICFLRNI